MRQRRPRSATRRPSKILSTGIGLGLIASLALLGAPALADDTSETPPSDGLLARYVFNQTTGDSIENNVDGGAPATVENSVDSQWTGKSLTFAGGAKNSAANWVQLPDDLLKDSDSATIITEVKIDASMKNTYNFLWNIGSTSTNQYYFTSVRDSIRTAITTTGAGGEANARGGALEADRWYNLTSVIDGAEGTIALYVDGEFVSETQTSLTPGAITNQSLNTIGRAPYPDPLFKGEVSEFAVYDRSLTASEIQIVADATGQPHADSFAAVAQTLLDSVNPLSLTDRITVLPDYGGQIVWNSTVDEIVIGEDGVTASATLPNAGQSPLQTHITATATVRGIEATVDVPVTLLPDPDETDDYGYLMVHFVEDSQGYAEKIYLDISRGNNAEQWDPLNSGKPILASDLGTTGVRDPYVTYNPESGTYYIIATDLRVFGGDNGSGNCTSWCHWSSQGSTKLNVWESTDLVTWSEHRQIDLATNLDGQKVAELGMSWAPEATWVPDYYAAGKGAFVLYWSSNIYADDDPGHSEPTYSRILWGVTPDFTADTYEYGGVFIDHGGNTIDTTMTQVDNTTYRVTKDNSFGEGLYMESTTDPRWWLESAQWTKIQEKIGASWSGGDPGGVEGPAIFKKHNEDTWYLYVDVIPTVGYRPMVTTNLEDGWETLNSPDFYMAPSTKHGGIIGLTKAQYNTLRNADAISAITPVLAGIELTAESSAEALAAALATTMQVNLAYGRGTSTLPVQWDVSALELDVPGDYNITGTVASLGSNLNDWVGKDGDTQWDAAERVPFSSTAITVTTKVTIKAAPVSPDPVNKAELQNAVDLVLSLDQGEYTESTWESLTDALIVAQQVLDNDDASQTQVDAATTRLLLAHSGLEAEPDDPPVDDEKDETIDDEKPLVEDGTNQPSDNNSGGDQDLAETGTNPISFVLSALTLVMLGAGALWCQVSRKN